MPLHPLRRRLRGANAPAERARRLLCAGLPAETPALNAGGLRRGGSGERQARSARRSVILAVAVPAAAACAPPRGEERARGQDCTGGGRGRAGGGLRFDPAHPGYPILRLSRLCPPRTVCCVLAPCPRRVGPDPRFSRGQDRLAAGGSRPRDVAQASRGPLRTPTS